MRFPMNDRMVLAFIGWLITVRKVSAATIKQYLSGLRTIHLKNGFLPGNLRPDIVNSILKGQEQEDSKSKVPRLAMTIPVMRLLKKLIYMSSMPQHKKRMIWTVCCLAFHGSFRIHELLSKKAELFHPTTTLLGQDIRLVKTKIDGIEEEILVVHLKMPKERSLGPGVNVELFATGTFSCPVNAWKKWRSLDKFKIRATKPVFQLANGKCLTGANLNAEIRTLLGPYIDYNKRKFLSHSFRAGMASMMALAGYKDEEIMRQGRWNSDAFKVYCKTGRANRLKEQRDLARVFANI